jgi:FtsP/CotA-like multicopper oxidase with cupredoxin domain
MGMGMGMMEERGRSFGIMSFGAKNIKSKLKPLPNSLVKVRRWSERDAVKTRIFALEMVMGMMNMMSGRTGVSINGKRMDMSRIDEKVKLNDIEIWEIENHSPMAHPFHVHNIQFQILDRNGQKPPLNEQGLKDTVLVQPSERVRIILQFEDYTDAQAPYMYHCHILEHEDAGMMGQFVVVDKV